LGGGGGEQGGVVGEDFNKKVILWVIAEKMKIYSYIHVGKIYIHRIFPEAWTNSKGLYSRIYLIWHQLDWKGAVLLNVPFIKQHLYWPKFLHVIFPLCFFIL